MYKKYRLDYKMHKNDNGNAFTICIEGENLQEIQKKKREALQNFRSFPIEARDWHNNPLYGFGKIPYLVTIE